MILGLAKLAVRNTLRRGKKSWITVIGVLIGISAVISLVSLGQGLETAISQEFQGLGANNLYVNGDLTEDDLETIRGVQGVDEAAAYLQRVGSVEFQGENQVLNVVGIDVSSKEVIFGGQGWSIESGENFRSTDRTDAIVAPGVGDSFDSDIQRNQPLIIENERFRKGGEFSAGDPSFQNAVLIPLETMREVFDVEDEVSQVTVRIQPGFTQEEVGENIMDELRYERDVEEGDEDFSVSTPQDILDTLTNILGVVQGIVLGLASVALVVGGVGIMNTMYMSINERTREIGVMKAIGASQRSIRILFLMEAGIIGLVGGILGVLLGIGISEVAALVANNFSSVEIARGYTLSLIAGSLVFATVLGLVSGYLPARRASKLDPADALRYE